MEKASNNKTKILVVNDDPMQLRMLSKLLEKDGKEVITCTGGEEALGKLRELKVVDLIVTDLYMPGIDGWKLCRLLRSMEFQNFNQTPILVISATFRGSDAEEITRELGADAFLSVPYSPEYLRYTIENLLSGKIDERKSRVLIVEDDKDLRETISEGFKEHGCLVSEASDGKQALSLFEEISPEIVILDYHLPNGDGDQLLEAFKSPQSHAAVLITTGDPNPDLAVKVTRKGADAFIRKPFKVQYIIDLCEKVHREWSLLRVETLLEDRTLDLQRILETSVDGIMIVDASDCIVQINSAIEMMLGHRRDEIVGKYIWELIPRDQGYYETTMRMVSDLKKKGKISGVEQTWKKKDGTLFHVELNLSMVEDLKGNQTGSLLCIRDITDKKKAEKELKGTKEFLEKVIETIGDGLLICDEKGKILSVNTALERMYGFTRKQMIGQHTSMFTLMEAKTLRKEILKRISELFEKGNVSYESVFKGKDGRLVDVECNNSMIRGDDGNYMAGVSIFRDISERKKAAKEIREAKEFLERVIENSRDGILITDEKGHIISANSVIEQLSNFKKEELLGKHVSILTIKDKEVREKIIEKTAELFEKGFANYESVHKLKDGSIITFDCISSLVKDDKGNPIAGVSILRDTTEKRKMEEQLRQSEKLKSLGELAGGVAHNFNNILAVILGRTQLLKRNTETAPGKQERRRLANELRKSLEIIEKASLDGADTVRRIQEFSRERSDDKKYTVINLNEVIERTLEFTKVRWHDEAGSKGIKIHIAKELTPLPSLVGSASELREVFINLINNALDAMPQGGKITIRTFTDNGHVVSVVEDTGVGIPRDILDNIFDPFFTTKGAQFSGLGMSSSYGIINCHHGAITADSIEGKGTRFTIKLPVLEERVEEEGKVKPLSGEVEKATILVIDDEEDVRELISDILTNSGHEVVIADDGINGIQLFKDKKFDLVFTDLGMPGMSGWQVAKEIKAMSRKVPVAVITGWDIELKKSEMKERGVDLIAHKPFKVDHILRLVQEGIELRNQFKVA
jgi:PAS domain S-box-containing protein